MMLTALPICGLVFSLLVGAPPAKSASAPEKAEPGKVIQEIVERTNAARAAKGLMPLKLQTNLSDAARWLAQDMAEKNYFDHTDRQGRSLDSRLPDFGYVRYRAIGENIAAGQPTPASVVAGWLKSPGHRANLLNAEFREIGVGYAARRGSKYRRYWVQDFGTRFNVYPVVINGEAAVTRRSQVKLAIYGEGWARQMRLSNDGEDWTPWEPYRKNREWTLEPGKGTRTVFVELRNEEGIVRRAQDSIELLPESPEAPRADHDHRETGNFE